MRAARLLSRVLRDSATLGQLEPLASAASWPPFSNLQRLQQACRWAQDASSYCGAARTLHTSGHRWAVTDVQVPPMGESITEGTVAAILRGEGQAVSADDVLLQIDTDKVGEQRDGQGGLPTLVWKKGWRGLFKHATPSRTMPCFESCSPPPPPPPTSGHNRRARPQQRYHNKSNGERGDARCA